MCATRCSEACFDTCALTYTVDGQEAGTQCYLNCSRECFNGCTDRSDVEFRPVYDASLVKLAAGVPVSRGVHRLQAHTLVQLDAATTTTSNAGDATDDIPAEVLQQLSGGDAPVTAGTDASGAIGEAKSADDGDMEEFRKALAQSGGL